VIGRGVSIGRRRLLAVLVMAGVAAGLVVAVNGLPAPPIGPDTETSNPPQTNALASHQTGACEPTTSGQPRLVGWRDSQLILAWKGITCAYDPDLGSWSALDVPPAAYATDGHTLAGPVAERKLSFVGARDRAVTVALPDWADDWGFWGSGLSSAPGGGYVFQTIPRLAVVTVTGELSDEPLPAGYLLVSTTSLHDVFLLREDWRASHPEAMNGPYTAFVWRRGDGDPVEVLRDVSAVRTAKAGLVWLRDKEGTWRLVSTGLSMERTLPATPGWESEPDPDGDLAFQQVDRADGCERASPPPCSSALVDLSSGRLLSSYPAGSNSHVAWDMQGAVFVPALGGGSTLPNSLVELTRDGATEIPLP
jgi:hypothetical protein